MAVLFFLEYPGGSFTNGDAIVVDIIIDSADGDFIVFDELVLQQFILPFGLV